MRRALTFIGIMLAGAVFTHLAFSAAVSAWVTDRYQHRLFNVRNIANQSLYAPLAQLFVEAQIANDPRPKILLFGSSFTWGYSWPEEIIFSAELQKSIEEYQILNLSVIGQDLRATIQFLCQIESAEVHVPLSIVEINIFNIAMDKSTLSQYQGCASTHESYALPGGDLSYFDFFLFHPWGFGHFEGFWDQYDYLQSESVYSIATLPESYFPNYSNFLQNQSEIRQLIEDSINIADHFSDAVILFTPPTLEDGLRSSDYPLEQIREIDEFVGDVCRSTENSSCLTADIWKDPFYFNNLTHLNMMGHEAFGKWMLPSIEAILH